MITEHALLNVKPGQEAAFEAAFATARTIIASARGCRGLTLSRGIENRSTYLLLVQWNSVADHEIGFRQSAAYGQWKELLHHFYEPFPVVEHFDVVDRTRGAGSR